MTTEDDKLLAELKQAQKEADEASIANATRKAQEAIAKALEEKDK